MGGVDLSIPWYADPSRDQVPARMGGVDLSNMEQLREMYGSGPRPHGRGGFKLYPAASHEKNGKVPARMGGVDLSWLAYADQTTEITSPPAWAGWI